MESNLKELMYRVKAVMEGEDLSTLLNEIKKDLSNQIVMTQMSEKEKREDLYLMIHGLKLLEAKMQECVNEVTKENE